MQQERDPLNLSSLPLVSPSTDDWPAIEAALREHRGRRRILKPAVWALAAAASLSLAVGLVLHQPGNLPPAGSDSAQTAMVQADTQESSAVGQPSTLNSLITLSQRLETSLRHMRADVGVMPTSSLIYQVELEDLVAQVDEELSMNPANRELWSQRVNLLLDLSQLYQNELRRESHRMASL